MKRILYLSVLACCLCACQESLEDRCAREAKDYTDKKCPAQVGPNITIDSLIFERSSHTLHYYYTLNGNADNEKVIASADVRKALLNEVKNSTSIKTYKDNGYRFAYTYYSQKDQGKVLFNAVFTEKDYK